MNVRAPAPTCTRPSTGRAPGPTRRSGAPRSAGSAAPGTGCSSGRRPAKRAASTSSTRCSPRAPGASVGTGLTCDSSAPSAPRSNGSRTTSSAPRVRISTTASWGPRAGASGRSGMAMARRSPPGGSPCNRRSRRQSHGSPASEAGCSTQQCSTGAGRSIPSASVYESTGAWPGTAWGIMPAPPCRREWPCPGWSTFGERGSMTRRQMPFLFLLAGVACHKDAVAPPPPPTCSQTSLLDTVPIAPNYGIHDMFVRDGIAFVFAWNSGVLIYDVGNGVKGGLPLCPVLISSLVTSASGISGGPAVHNGWWFWNPNTNEKKYLFIGQEGPAIGGIGVGSAGLIHVGNGPHLEKPHEVAYFHKAGTDSTGTHNFWMDEQKQILYAAYYNGGVVALDVSATLSGDLSSRLIDSLRIGGKGNTYTWGVHLYNGSLYAIDMLSGLWQLNANSGALSIAGGGDKQSARYSSDCWVFGGYAYSGTWDWIRRTSQSGAMLKVWQLGGTGAPAPVDSIITPNISAVSDVEVSSNGKVVMFSAEGGTNSGLYFYSLTNPAHPTFLAYYPVSAGLHTATFGYINGHVYAFAARNPGSPALMIWDVTSLVQ